nr:hypothetical protein [Chloroflexota bacterium]
MTSVNYFIPDTEANALSHVVAAYVGAYTETNDLVIDPFCQSPTIVMETHSLGRRVIAVTFNPLDALRTRLALTPPPTRELIAAVTRLGDWLKAGVPLREHLSRLYRIPCPQCSKEIIADYFIWERGQDIPKRVSYRCAACGDAGLRDCDESDARVLREIQPRGLHYWYMLDRVARREGSGRKFAISLLELYTPRNLYVLSNLVLKIDDLFSGTVVHDFLRLALLHCLELGSKLNTVPGEPAAPHTPHLHPPTRFVEWNIWQIFEDTARRLAQQQPVSTVPLAASVKDVVMLPHTAEARESTPAVRAFVGRMPVRQLVPELPAGSVNLILTLPPQIGRTYWALPYLWTGWLYGHVESSLLWPLVRRRSSDWPWYLRVIGAIFSTLQKTLDADGHIVFLGQNKGLAYHETLALAASRANLRLESALYHPREPEAATKPFAGLRGDYRFTWTPGASLPLWPMSSEELTARLRQIAVAAAEEVLQQRGEPAPFARLHCHIWQTLAQRGVLQRVMSIKEPISPLDWVRDQIKAALQEEIDRTLVQLWEEGEEDECLWWLKQAPDIPPLTERVEQATYEILTSVASIELTEFMRAIYQCFPGVLTPDAEWVMACLKSYGQQIAAGHWALKDTDHLEQRVEARERILHTLADLGKRWGYKVEFGTQGVNIWWVQPERTILAFVVLDSAALHPLFGVPVTDEFAKARKLVIFPEARLDLLRLKLARSMTLRKQLAAQGWQFIQDVALRQWASQADIALAGLDSLVSLDPLAIQNRTQLSFM